MKKTRKAIYILLYLIAIILVLFSLLSLLRNTPSRYLKLLDFPRIQFFMASFICLAAIIFLTRNWRWWDYTIVAGLLIAMGANGFFLVNYTGLVPVDVPAAGNPKPSDESFSLLVINVKMSNRSAQHLIKLIKEKQPDLVLAMEVDNWWDGQLRGIEQAYPYSQETINEVAYGMVLYSRFPLKDTAVKYLHNEKVPSFTSSVLLPGGKKFSFHCVHPVPPTHFEDLPDNAEQQEMALVKLGREIEKQQPPVIVAGDLNDVVWSKVDALTHTKNLLHDVRTGRGFYNSYNADHFFARWPLDHVFVTKEFRLKNLRD